MNNRDRAVLVGDKIDELLRAEFNEDAMGGCFVDLIEAALNEKDKDPAALVAKEESGDDGYVRINSDGRILAQCPDCEKKYERDQ